MICSIGTGQMVKPFKYDDAVNWGLAGWVRPLLDIMFDGVASTTDYELDQLPGISHIRLQASLEHASEALDDAEPGNLADLIRTGQETIAKNLPSVQALRAKLAEPMATREALGYPKPGAATRSGSMRPALVSRRPVALVAKAQPAISAPASPPTTPAAVFPLGLGATGGLVAGPVGFNVFSRPRALSGEVVTARRGRRKRGPSEVRPEPIRPPGPLEPSSYQARYQRPPQLGSSLRLEASR